MVKPNEMPGDINRKTGHRERNNQTWKCGRKGLKGDQPFLAAGMLPKPDEQEGDARKKEQGEKRPFSPNFGIQEEGKNPHKG